MTRILLIKSRSELSEHLNILRGKGLKIGVVATMGALHEGHLSLIREAKRLSDVVVTTIFVNPTQFAPGEDFEAYPRDLPKDMSRAESAGCDIVFAPSKSEMYASTEFTTVQVNEVTEGLCGASRPGHFNGVTTVVAKLFNVIGPALAFFGQKDYQQLRAIETMTRELFFPIKIVGCPTLPDSDGLALSSRNAYLSTEERQQATHIPESLRAAEVAFMRGEKRIEQLLQLVKKRLVEAHLSIEYVELRDAKSLQSLEGVITETAVLAVAIKIGTTRLIDNMLLEISNVAEAES